MANNDILKFAGSALSMLTDVQYASLNAAGHVSGVASSALENKALKNASAIAAGVAQFIADNQGWDILDALTPAQIAAYMTTAINAIVQPQLVPDASTSVKGKIEIATAVETRFFSSTILAMTPNTLWNSQTDVMQSLTEQGYQRFVGGMIVIWGYASVAVENQGDVPTTVNLSSILSGGFPSACANIQLTLNQDSSFAGNRVPFWKNKSSTSFQIGIDGNGASEANPQRVDFRCIGY